MLSPSAPHHWTLGEITALYESPLLELVYRAATVHRQLHDARQVQVCKLISIKTGDCPEDCSYCAQASRYKTEVDSSPLMEIDEVVAIAKRAKADGASRVCLGAAWREVRDNLQFERVLGMVRQITDLGIEVCCTLGMLTEAQARRLDEAGLYAYNHNIDTSADHYHTIITTRKFADRLQTIEHIRKTSITVCCGGILGIGETVQDRVAMLHTLCNMKPHPESVPINILAKVPGTPLAAQAEVPITDVVRMVAMARITMPAAMVRLSAGRAKLSFSEQALCFMAGVNSIFSSETKVMLTAAAPSPDFDADKALLNELGLYPSEPFEKERKAESEKRK